ncbi:MAG TPA: hypothetical protein VM553_10150, partial [Dongiaceae bacterium]|nr:hypothetical protein [Dongiaceae bacterium]
MTGKGGRVFLFAPEVVTESGSSITTPDGQTILAGSKDHVYLAASQDQDLRGMLVEVNTGGNIDHAGKIVAERGNITLAALNIEQKGQLTATTSVDANGTIRLLARDTVDATLDIGSLPPASNKNAELYAGALMADGALDTDMSQNSAKVAKARQTGSVEFHAGSNTEVLADTSDKKATYSDPKQTSFVEVMGKTIDVNGGATVTSRGGIVSMVATTDPQVAANALKNDSRITLHTGSRIDVSGMTTAQIDMERNSLEVELRGDELKDSPLQRNDTDVRGKTAYVDIRDKDSIEFADITKYVDKIERPVAELLSEGGKVNLHSQGSVDFQNGAVVDVSGGAVNYKSGYVKESRLVDRNGDIHYISDADPNRDYAALLNENERYNARWNITEKLKSSTAGAGKGTFVQGYTEGKDAGALNITFNSLSYDGQVIANTVTGPYQRTQDSAVNGGAINLKALGGNAQSIELLSEEYFQQFAEARANGSAPIDTTAISVERFRNSADNLTIHTWNGDLTLGENAQLKLDGGGKVDLSTQGGDLLVKGDIVNHGGDVKLKAGRLNSSDSNRNLLSIESGSVIDTSGNWVNDNPLLKPDLRAPIRIDAGAIALTADGDVAVREGARLNANGSAWLDSDGKLTAGNGGNIKAEAGNLDQLDSARNGRLVFDGEASSHSLGKGGELSLRAAGFRIGDSLPPADDLTVNLAPEFFRHGGFSKIALNAGRTGIDVADGSRVDLIGERYRLKGTDFRATRSSEGLAPLVEVIDTADLPATQRARVDLSLNSGENAAAKEADTIRIGAGASINGLPGANVSISTTGGSIDIGGAIIAKGGNVDLSVAPNGAMDFDPSRAVRLRDGSLIDVGATTVEGSTDSAGRVDRQYFDGGSANISAAGGYILGEKGSRISADGELSTAQYLDAKTSQLKSQSVALDGGAINLSASEGMLANTGMSAKAASPNGKAGAIDVRMTSAGRSGGEILVGDARKDYELEIRLIGDELDNVFLQSLINSTNIENAITVAGGSIASGVAYLNVDAVNAGGFGRVGLHTINDSSSSRQSYAGTERKETKISFATDKTLTASESIRLETPAIVTSGFDASVAAPYISIGTQYTDEENSKAGAALPVSGSFTASADFIDLQGDIVFRDAGKVNLRSHGDIRLRGGLANAGTRDLPAGSLLAYGDVELLASQVYAATQTDYTFDLQSAGSTVRVRNQSDGSFTIKKDYGVYSALGSLTVNADHIEQQGVLKAPFGSIELNGRQSLVLDSGSKTSVSGENQTVIFGEVQADGSWLYPVKSGEPQVISALQEKSVKLKSPSLEQREGAAVDISGGGDLLAYEFAPGPGGSKDVLNYGGNFAGAGESFAIVPTYGSQWAPYDTVEMANFPYAIGDTIRFEATPGLNPNVEYAILPARYALLPGAFLITPQHQSIQPGMNITNLTSAKVVSGKVGNAGNTTEASQWSAFMVEPGSVAFSRSEYNLYSANGFFADAIGTRPQDAGRVSFDAIDKLDIEGDIVAASERGVGGRMDVNATDLKIVNSKTVDGGIQLVADELQAFNVDSILLGGTRNQIGNETNVNVGANSVTVAGDVDLTVSELILAGKQQVVMESGANVEASRNGRTVGGPIRINGDGALLQASVGDAVQVLRSGASGTGGALNIQSGASVVGKGALVLDATGSALVAGHVDTTGTAGFGSSRIVLGVDQVSSGMALSQAVLDNLSARDLMLTSLSSIDLASEFIVDTRNLVLDAAAINAVSGAPIAARFNASESVTLKNSSGQQAVDVGAAGSTLTFGTRQLNLAGNAASTAQKLGGFSQVAIAAQDGTRASGKFSLQTPGSLSLSTGRLDAVAGSDLAVQAGGDLVLTGTGNVAKDGLAGFGARYTFAGNNVMLDTQVRAASGVISVQAQESLALGNNAALDVAGKVVDFAGDKVVSDAGTISLVAKNGNITTQAGTVIDVSSPDPAASSGTLQLSAANGRIDLQSAPVVQRSATSTGGVLKVDVAQADNVASLSPQLAGFSESQTWRARNGNLTLGENTTVKADSIEFSLDGGSLQVDGHLDASGKDGGTLGLYARDNVILGTTAQLDANATGVNGDGGKVVLSSKQGFIELAGGSAVNVGGAGIGDDGKVQFLAQRNGANDDVQFTDNGVSINGAGSVVVAGFKSYETADVNQAWLDATVLPETTSFMAAMQTKLEGEGRFANLVQQLGDRFEVAPGVELFNQGSMTVSGDVSLAPAVEMDAMGGAVLGADPWRFGDKATPGFLRVVAGGDLTVNGKLSDGFVTLTNIMGVSQTAPISARSWSLSVIAGADGQAAKPSTLQGQGNVVLASGSLIRTGTGDITVVAGNDVTLAEGSSIYTGGLTEYVNDPVLGGMPEAGTLDGLQWIIAGLIGDNTRLFYGHDGGDISVDVGNDVIASGIPVAHTEWLNRLDGEYPLVDVSGSEGPEKYLSSWGVNYDKFVNGIGTLGGGDIELNTGRDVINLTLAAATTAMQVGANPSASSTATNQVLIRGGGDIAVNAGRDVLSGNYLVSDGKLDVTAGGSISRVDTTKAAAQIAYGIGDISLKARDSIELTRAIDQSMAPISDLQSTDAARQNFYFTHASADSLSMQSLVGDVIFNPETGGADSVVTNSILPARLKAVALDGNIQIRGPLGIEPHRNGELELYAMKDIAFVGQHGSLQMSSVQESRIPSRGAAYHPGSGGTLLEQLGLGHFTYPVSGLPSNHTDSTEDPVRLVALSGDIRAKEFSTYPRLQTSKAAEIMAGRDIRNVGFSLTNNFASDVSTISAGRDFVVESERTPSGQVAAGSNSKPVVQVNGPGTLL